MADNPLTHKLEAGEYVEVAGVRFLVLTNRDTQGELIEVRLEPIDKRFVQPAYRYCDYGRIW